MVFIKAIKTKSYFKRFQTQFRRRREGKTDYYARKRLIIQDKNKYNAPKYRLVVRITNRDVICQVIAARIDHDEVLTAAYSHELPRYGLTFGLTNYAAAYATGLLLARRTLAKLGLDKAYEGVKEATGEFYEVEESGERRPFRAVLDVGLAHTTTGNRIFGAMKGAVDGGIAIPHSEKRFPGYDAEGSKFDPAVLRKYIFGVHVSEYAAMLKEEDEEKYNRQFSVLVKNKINPDQIEALYKKAHKAIRADPSPKNTEKKVDFAAVGKKFKRVKLNNKARRNRVNQIKAANGITI